MRKTLCALLLCACLLPLPALAGDPSDPLRDLGITAALQGTAWQNWRHEWNIYYDGADRALAILNNGQQWILMAFARSAGAWRVAEHWDQALCRGIPPLVSLGRAVERDPAGEYAETDDLLIAHAPTPYTSENYVFTQRNGQWVFRYAILETPTADVVTDTDYAARPWRIAYVTWRDGALAYDWYLSDAYGELPGLPRVDQPGNGAWIAQDTPGERVPWPGPITLDTFNITDFPKDSYTQAWVDGPDYLCDANSGRTGATYAVVNNPNPKDRLNLRVRPDARAEYLGKYYNGTELYVAPDHSQDGGPDWVRVDPGNGRMGYMMRRFLAFGEAGDAVAPAMPAYTMPGQPWQLLIAPFDESHAKADFVFVGGESIRVMGVVNGWWHVQCGTATGFIRQLEPLD
ncbi:MAG: SH3 domain-containing protein [Oscillospiraceae bacterium]|jgi:hypothetical protein|nr:SH3 domain-containing protein [Oscillospiraceae bacterium]